MIDPDNVAPLVVASRTLLGLLFLSAAAGKLRDPASFHGAVHAYRLLPGRLVGPVAIAIPWLEVMIGLLLPSGVAPTATALAACLMLLVFAGAMAVNMLRGRRDIDCGCFRYRPSQRLSWPVVLRTLALAGPAGLSGLPCAATVADAVQGLTAGALLFLLFVTATVLPTFGRTRPRISL